VVRAKSFILYSDISCGFTGGGGGDEHATPQTMYKSIFYTKKVSQCKLKYYE